MVEEPEGAETEPRQEQGIPGTSDDRERAIVTTGPSESRITHLEDGAGSGVTGARSPTATLPDRQIDVFSSRPWP